MRLKLYIWDFLSYENVGYFLQGLVTLKGYPVFSLVLELINLHTQCQNEVEVTLLTLTS